MLQQYIHLHQSLEQKAGAKLMNKVESVSPTPGTKQ